MSDEWLTKLKAGDKVYSQGGGVYPNSIVLHTVKKITQKGHIRLDNDELYREGYHKCDSFGGRLLIQWTPKLEAKLKAAAHLNHMQYTINAIDMRTVDADIVQAVYDIMGFGKGKD